ncbi:hypothetical protein [Candidatus Nitronereus thalassa]|uniref:Glycosyl hydrolase family 30 beta sandwich domain-containing protein n=1 Tax=Candidatus Nitronereus thalassa TaxID=3020898 RepID=A0ABU3KAK0_9BACT|nr:hypothetical protein [Candidatus Nitronereus thalassa]MDT7043446.1 hypothetical protein [Candidatus Nitronereus thalassa]
MGMFPSGVHSRVPPSLADGQIVGERHGAPPPHRSWSAFRSDDAKNVCVTVVNYGGGEILVHLFHKRSLAGAFTVQSQEASAMCSDVTVIELECESDTCQPEWYISEFH